LIVAKGAQFVSSLPARLRVSPSLLVPLAHVELLEQWTKSYEMQMKKVKAEKDWINKFKTGAQAAQAASRLKKLEKWQASDEWVQRYVWRDGWMDGWMGGWMDGWVDGWMDGWI